MTGSLNRAAWAGFDVVFRPWMRWRMHVCMGGIPQLPLMSGPVMLVSNHVSWWDGFLLRQVQCAVRPSSPLYTVALERELELHPVLRLIGGVGITPSSPPSILHALRSLMNKCTESPGAVVSYFPQGCISPSFRRPLGFAPGVEIFARRLGPITLLPVAIHIEPLTGTAPTAFVLVGAPRMGDADGADVAALERDVTQLLDTLLADLALFGEQAARVWWDAYTLRESVPDPRPHVQGTASPIPVRDA